MRLFRLSNKFVAEKPCTHNKASYKAGETLKIDDDDMNYKV